MSESKRDYIEKTWREVSSRTAISGADFVKGVKDFKFSVAQGYAWIPNQSYFRITLKLTVGGASPTVADTVCFSDNVCGNLWNNIYFNMGGQSVSQIVNGAPQIDILKNRLTKSRPYMNSIGEIQGLSGHWFDRRKRLVPPLSEAGGNSSFELTEKYYTEIFKNQRDFVWQPAIGIMDSSDLFSAGEYEFQLNPSQDYKLAGIQTEPYLDGLTVAGGAGPDLEVIDVKLYVCTCRTNSASSGVDTYHFRETELLSANVRAGAGNINEEFSVPSTTDSITLFIQDNNAGKNTNVPSSRFHNKYLQIDGNPTTTWTH